MTMFQNKYPLQLRSSTQIPSTQRRLPHTQFEDYSLNFRTVLKISGLLFSKFQDFMTMFQNKYPLHLRGSTQIPQQVESQLKDGYLILSVAIKENEVGIYFHLIGLSSVFDS